jgi:hypothetical protein
VHSAVTTAKNCALLFTYYTEAIPILDSTFVLSCKRAIYTEKEHPTHSATLVKKNHYYTMLQGGLMMKDLFERIMT